MTKPRIQDDKTKPKHEKITIENKLVNNDKQLHAENKDNDIKPRIKSASIIEEQVI